MKSGLMFVKLVNPCSGKLSPPSPPITVPLMFLNIAAEKRMCVLLSFCASLIAFKGQMALLGDKSKLDLNIFYFFF